MILDDATTATGAGNGNTSVGGGQKAPNKNKLRRDEARKAFEALCGKLANNTAVNAELGKIRAFLCPAGSKESVFDKLFPNAKVGDSITVKGVFDKTQKGRSDMTRLMYNWKNKGITVEYVENFTTPVDSKYVIKSM
ncbi:MAG: hypothetical protein Pg6A_19740 [Termitinemataceae bacterium]|nr:MAG: hypothetical protein Pg6A_19740 [Termitinemataceae bacterium]